MKHDHHGKGGGTHTMGQTGKGKGPGRLAHASHGKNNAMHKTPEPFGAKDVEYDGGGAADENCEAED